MSTVRRLFLALLVGVALVPAAGLRAQQLAPTPQPVAASAVTPKQAVVATRHMVAAANPIAAAAGREILRQGGSALDAAIAVQMVLNLVEPQSSGIGGGAFLVHYDATAKAITTYDGRETAPERVAADWFMGPDGKPLPFARAAVGGHAVGVPGLLRMLEMAHKDHGRLPWARNFEQAIQLARDGFAVSQRLHRLIADTPQLKEYEATRKYFFDPAGNPRAVGAQLVNDAFAEALRQIANGGAEVFYTGGIAQDIVAAIETTGARTGLVSLTDLAHYRAVKREAVCSAYRAYRICGMGPPSSGGIAVAQTLNMLEGFAMARLAPGSLDAVHVITEATRLAFADRNRYVADSDHVPVPVRGLLEPGYLAERARLIDPLRRAPNVEPGNPRHARLEFFPPTSQDTTAEIPATSHVSVIDGSGNAVAMSTTIENAFGARVFVRGFLLNNQLTDFAFNPRDGERVVANAVAGGKRPRSSMSPTIVTDAEGRLLLTVGSPGGARIIPFVVQTLVGVLDWGLDVQTAISQPRHVTLGGPLEIERGSPLGVVAAGLRERGHNVVESELVSGLQGIAVIRDGSTTRLVGGADPRREGEALGD
ncbi:MAG: gamma-glutamyltransferase [Alphaproteobacteria bacterium]|nr:gamma-glutamyltransferase [Alphaproteobacteria bacterium]